MLEQRRPQQNGIDTAALVLGKVALFTPFLAATLAVISGYIVLGECNRDEATNRRMALRGIWLGWVSSASWAVLYLVGIKA